MLLEHLGVQRLRLYCRGLSLDHSLGHLLICSYQGIAFSFELRYGRHHSVILDLHLALRVQ